MSVANVTSYLTVNIHYSLDKECRKAAAVLTHAKSVGIAGSEVCREG